MSPWEYLLQPAILFFLLGVVAALITAAMAFSLMFKPKEKKAVVGEEYLLKDE